MVWEGEEGEVGRRRGGGGGGGGGGAAMEALLLPLYVRSAAAAHRCTCFKVLP